MSKEENLILVGVISAANGIKGDLLIKSYTEISDSLTQLPILYKNNNPLKLKLIRKNSKGGLVCRLDSCNSRNEAELLKGTKLYCLRKDLPIPDEEEFYINDLRGLKVLDQTGESIGEIAEVANYGAGDIIEIKFNDNSYEMFPFTEELFPEITKNHIVLHRTEQQI
ncbi:MAG: ribosome maturation factor RimM [Rickettsiaceae bacterium]|nr:ribosome maturation factor RimM [Rickettsiaceae bacterium]